MTQPRSISSLGGPSRTYQSPPDFTKEKFEFFLMNVAVRALRLPGTSGIAVAVEEDGHFVCRAAVGETAPTLGIRFDGSEGITGECIRTQQTITCEDVHFDHRVNLQACEALGIASLVAVPIVLDGRAVGVLEAFAIEPGALRHRTILKLEKLADEIAARFTEREQGPDTGREENDSPENTLRLVGPGGNHRSGNTLQANADALFVDFSEPTLFTRLRRRSTLLLRMFIGALLATSVIMVIYWRYQEKHATQAGSAAATNALPSEKTPLLPTLFNGTEEAPDIRQIQAAAQRGDQDSQVKLATALAEGADVPQDFVAAHAWYIIANGSNPNNKTPIPPALGAPLTASQTASVRMNVAKMFENGTGVRKDLVSSYYWLILAEAAGAPEAKAEQRRLATSMNPEQIALAKSRATTWLIQHGQKPAS